MLKRLSLLDKLMERLSVPWKLVLGFLVVILAGSILLYLPFAHHAGYAPSFIDCLFVSFSAVCVTGLTTIPIGYTFNVFGRAVLVVLMQIGGWGVAAASVVFALFVGHKISLKSRTMLMEAGNFSGYSHVVSYVRLFMVISLICEAIGAVLCLPVFVPEYGFFKGVGYAIFHAVSAFNNAGFDCFGGMDSLLAYKDNVYMILVTSGLIITGGFGFLALMDVFKNRKSGWKSWSLNTKIVSVMTLGLLVFGTLVFKLTTSQTWLQAFFQSVIARTAGFNTYPIANFSSAALLVFCLLMFIGASPGSTGGGIKTTTAFAVALKAISSTMHNNRDSIYYRHIPSIVFEKALTVTFFSFFVGFCGVFLLLCFQPDISLNAALVEVISAVATVGSSYGITPDLCFANKIVIMVCMFIGRLGPVTIATLLVIKGPKEVRYTDESIMIG
jgi:trk system potassium uptake protein TrkH